MGGGDFALSPDGSMPSIEAEQSRVDQLWVPAGRTLTQHHPISLGALALVFGVVAAWSFLRPQTPMPVERFESPFRDAQEPTGMGGGDFALSPDGSMLVYRGPGEQSGVDQLWVRRWEDLDARFAAPTAASRPACRLTVKGSCSMARTRSKSSRLGVGLFVR